MTSPVQSALTRRDRIWPAALVSALIHAVLIGVAVARGAAPEIDLEQKPIVAKLVRLGPERPKELLPRKEEPPAPVAAAPEPAPAPPTPAPPAPAPTPTVTKAPAAKPAPIVEKTAPVKTPTAPQGAPARASARPGGLAGVLDRVRKQVDEQRWGSPDGDPMGDASEGEAGDRYLALVTRALQENYRLPSTISESERMHLRAQVALFIEPDGRITRYSFERRSGNGAFDDALERAIRQTRVPPPPPELREAYRSRGISVLFRV